MLNVNEIIQATSGSLLQKNTDEFTGVSIDSRSIKNGELFIALKGNRVDGHKFVNEALETGSGAIIQSNFCSKNLMPPDKTLILVEDTLLALQDIAKYKRQGFKDSVIGVIGSNGKTTTKELISEILQLRFKVLKTVGNFNNHIGMPMSISKLEKDTRVMILEMGTNKSGDIKELCDIARPSIGVITNIGYEHIKGFGSLEGVRDAELEILPYIEKLVVNGDDWFLLDGIKSAYKGSLITFGIKSDNLEIKADDIEACEDGTRFQIDIQGQTFKVETRLFGHFNVYNCLAAVATSYIMGLSQDEIKKGLEAFNGVEMRFEIKKIKDITFIYDVYNANPSSIEASLIEYMRLAKLKYHKRTIVVLGDMLELGDYAIYAHKELGKKLSLLQIDMFIGVGDLMSIAASEFTGRSIIKKSPTEAGYYLNNILKAKDIVLIKGSRDMKMKKVFDEIEKSLGGKQ